MTVSLERKRERKLQDLQEMALEQNLDVYKTSKSKNRLSIYSGTSDKIAGAVTGTVQEAIIEQHIVPILLDMQLTVARSGYIAGKASLFLEKYNKTCII